MLVRSLGDLPTPVGGVITLEAGKTYQVCGLVDISPNSLVLGDRTTLSGGAPATDGISSTGFAASAMISAGAGTNTLVEGLQLSSPGGVLFDVDLGGTGTISMFELLLTGCASLGTVQNFVRFTGHLVGIGSNQDGWTIQGTNEDVLWTNMRVSNNLGTFTLFKVPDASGTVCRNMIFETGIVDLDAGQTGFDFPDPASGLIVNRGLIDSVFFSGVGDPIAIGLGKITKATIGWWITMSPPLVTSVSIGGAGYSLIGGAGNSTGALVAGTFVPIPSAPSPFVASASNERFSASAAGVLTHTGIDPIQVKITVSVSVDMTGAGTNNFGCAVYLNGLLVPNSEQTSQVSSAGSATSAITTSAVVTLNQGDTLQGVIRNNSSGNPMNVYAAQIIAVPAN